MQRDTDVGAAGRPDTFLDCGLEAINVRFFSFGGDFDFVCFATENGGCDEDRVVNCAGRC